MLFKVSEQAGFAKFRQDFIPDSLLAHIFFWHGEQKPQTRDEIWVFIVIGELFKDASKHNQDACRCVAYARQG